MHQQHHNLCVLFASCRDVFLHPSHMLRKKHLQLLADFLSLFHIERGVLKNICTAQQHVRVEVIGKNLFYKNICLGKKLG